MRAFGKEAAACDRYRDAVLKMQGWGLKSAALSGLFGGFNATFTTGTNPSVPSQTSNQVIVRGRPFCVADSLYLVMRSGVASMDSVGFMDICRLAPRRLHKVLV